MNYSIAMNGTETMDTETLKQRVADQSYWYHRIELPGGVVTPGWAPLNALRYCIPEDMTGMRVLDIGAWDGYWTWEALKRGAADVVAIDDFSDTVGQPIKRDGWKTFDLCREAFDFTEPFNDGWIRADNQQFVRRLEMSVYDLQLTDKDWEFDVVFFFGTLYHLKHPLLALEKIAAVCNGAIYVETASLDEYSPYRGGLGKGFDQNEMVCEFYPGREYGDNEGNWWAPTLQCLGAMMASVGFRDIEGWPLTEEPKSLAECRGFLSGTKDPARVPACRPAEVATYQPRPTAKVAAVMSVPRLGFMDNMTCANQTLFPLRIPLINVQGAFWGQVLERGMQMIIDSGADIILTIDYDTAFTRADVEGVLRLMAMHPEASAIVPVQRGRGEFPVLMSMKTLTGQMRKEVPLTELREAETTKIASGHFGLTALRVKDLLKMPHPWFHDQPNAEGQWGPGRIDADIYFWKQLETCGLTALLANRITVGHLELMVKWVDGDMQPIYQHTNDFHDNGKPANCWK